MRILIKSSLVAAAVCVLSAPDGVWGGEVDLGFVPAVSTVLVDEVVEIDIIATSYAAVPQDVAAIEAILDWDTEFLELLGIDDANAGYTWFVSDFLPDPDGINDDLANGNALYTALARQDSPAVVPPPPGLIVTTVQFRASAPTAGTLVSFVPALGVFGKSRVLEFYTPGLESTGNITSTETESIGDLPVETTLDIHTGSCPNPVNPSSRGKVPMALVGSELFDVTEVDVDSLVLSRADGLGRKVTPLAGRSGVIGEISDVATPFGGDLCECHELMGDGIVDLLVRFSAIEMADALALDGIPHGTSVMLTISGSMLDGMPFEVSDCAVRVGRSVTSTSKGISQVRSK